VVARLPVWVRFYSFLPILNSPLRSHSPGVIRVKVDFCAVRSESECGLLFYWSHGVLTTGTGKGPRESVSFVLDL